MNTALTARLLYASEKKFRVSFKTVARNEADRLWGFCLGVSSSTPQNGGRIYGKACQYLNLPYRTARKIKRIDFKLYAITDRHRCAPTPLADVVSELLDAGVTAIQLREKDLGDTELIQLAQPIAEVCRNYKAKLFINTSDKVLQRSTMSIAGAAGVHLPANAESVKTVKARTDDNLYVGCSVHSLDAAQKRETEGADFVTYSPIYRTASKPGYGPAVGVEHLAEMVKGVKIPVFALGGITPARVTECLAVGAFGVAVMSGVMSPANAGEQARRYLDFFNDCF